MELGPTTRAFKFPYLHLQLLDKDLAKFDDAIAEAVLDMEPYYSAAYHSKDVVTAFATTTAKGRANGGNDDGHVTAPTSPDDGDRDSADSR